MARQNIIILVKPWSFVHPKRRGMVAWTPHFKKHFGFHPPAVFFHPRVLASHRDINLPGVPGDRVKLAGCSTINSESASWWFQVSTTPFEKYVRQNWVHLPLFQQGWKDKNLFINHPQQSGMGFKKSSVHPKWGCKHIWWKQHCLSEGVLNHEVTLIWQLFHGLGTTKMWQILSSNYHCIRPTTPQQPTILWTVDWMTEMHLFNAISASHTLMYTTTGAKLLVKTACSCAAELSSKRTCHPKPTGSLSVPYCWWQKSSTTWDV